jgi:hypothetical protein
LKHIEARIFSVLPWRHLAAAGTVRFFQMTQTNGAFPVYATMCGNHLGQFNTNSRYATRVELRVPPPRPVAPPPPPPPPPPQYQKRGPRRQRTGV